MLDCLPPEIIDASLVLTHPPSPWPDQDDVDSKRRQTLTSLSLVCKAVSAVAQNLLWRELSVESRDKLDFTRRLQKLQTPLKAKVQTVRTKKHVALQEMLVVVPQCPGVKKLQCTNGRTTWEQLSSFPSLHTIELYNVEIRPAPTDHPLLLQPFNLVHLSILAVYFSQKHDFDRVLQPDVLPNLLTLWIGHCGHHHDLRGYVPLVSSNLAKQLDMIQISKLRSGLGDSERYGRLQKLDSLIAGTTLPNSLKSLVLPSFLRRLDYSMTLSRGKRDDLLKACTAKKVEVVWHAKEGGLYFSKAFSAYAKRLKAQAVEAGETEQTASVTM